MTHLINDHYHVELPEGAVAIQVSGDCIFYFRYKKVKCRLTTGNYTLSFTRDTQTEEGWKGVVEKKETIYKGDWFVDYNDEFDCIKPATASGHSLLESKGIDHKLNFVIIKKM